jgi:hypothetical protein
MNWIKNTKSTKENYAKATATTRNNTARDNKLSSAPPMIAHYSSASWTCRAWVSIEFWICSCSPTCSTIALISRIPSDSSPFSAAPRIYNNRKDSHLNVYTEYGRHINDWLFARFSLSEIGKKLWQKEKEWQRWDGLRWVEEVDGPHQEYQGGRETGRWYEVIVHTARLSCCLLSSDCLPRRD